MGRHVTIVAETERLSVTVPGYDSTFTIRRLHPDALETIEARHRTRTRNKRTGQEVTEVPADARADHNKDLWDHLVLDWRDVDDGDGQPVPCTRDNKWALPGAIKAALLEYADEGNVSGLRLDGAGGVDPTRA